MFQKKVNNFRNEIEYSSVRRFIDLRSEELILDLVSPRAGERILDVGFGNGDRLGFFRNHGCGVTGIERSIEISEITKKSFGPCADIYKSYIEDLPFSDNEFDIVILIDALEFARDPQKAISEAVRVSRDRVFLGTWNKYAIMNSYERFKYFVYPMCNNPARLLGRLELVRLIRNLLPSVPIKWGSVFFFPLEWYTFTSGIEMRIPTMKNPFGAFLGFSFPVNFYYKTIQDVIRKPLSVKSKRRHPLQGVARDMKR
jgi:SAM-dependent methyltransferase